MTNIEYSRRMRFVKYFANDSRFESEAAKVVARNKAQRRRPHNRISSEVSLTQTETDKKENERMDAINRTDLSTRTDNNDSSPIASQLDGIKKERQKEQKQLTEEEIPPRNTPSPSDEVKGIWKRMQEAGEPKMIISIPRFSYTYNLNQETFYMETLRKALAEVVKNGKCCGILFDKNDRSFFKKILNDEIQLEELKDKLYGVIASCELSKRRNDHEEEKTVDKQVDNWPVFDKNIKLLALERYINKSGKSRFYNDAEKESRLPVVLLVVGGDLCALAHVSRAVHHDISVVVIKGTGGTADFIDSFINGKVNIRRTLPLMYMQRFEKDHFKKIGKAVNRIRQREWMVSSCDLKSETDKSLWEKITDGIIRAWSFENAKGDYHFGDPKPTNQGLSISEHAVKIKQLSKKQLFGGYDLKSIGTNIKTLQMTFTNAMVMNNIDIVLDILSRSDGFHLTEEQYAKLIRALITEHSKPGNTNSFTLLKSIFPKTVESMDSKEAMTVICDNLLKVEFLSRCGHSVCCCCGRNDKNGNKSPENDFPERMLLTGILFNRVKIFQIWRDCNKPLMTALVASAILSSLAEKAGECFEEQLQENFSSHSNVFMRRAVLLLEKLYEFNQSMGKEALDHVCKVWNQHESPIYFSHQHNIEEFISHSHVQKEADRRMYGYTTDMTLHVNSIDDHVGEGYANKNNDSKAYSDDVNTIRESKEDSKPDDPPQKKKKQKAGATKAFGTHSIIKLIKYHWQGNSMEQFICAPIVRLCIHVTCFVTAIVIFSIFVTTNLKDKSVSFLEILVLVFIIGEFVEESISMLRPDERSNVSNVSRTILHLYDIWNILDYLCIILYMVAFSLHSFAVHCSLVHIRRLYSVTLFLMFLRLFNFLLLFKKLGMIIIMVKEMLKDLFYYLVILFVLLFGGGVVYHANLFPNHDIQFRRIWTVLRIPFWQVFGDPMLDTIEASDGGDCTNNETIWQNNPDVDRCPSYDWIAPVIAALYMMLTNWLLLNIVIAMFSSRFEAIWKKASLKWRYHRHSVVIDYEHRYPSPFNIPIRMFFSCVRRSNTRRRIRIRCCCHCCKINEKPKAKPDEMLKKQREFAKQIVEEEEHMKLKK